MGTVDALKWLVAIEAIGLVAWPLTYAAFPGLRDRGYGFAKPLGLLTAGFLVWILSYGGLIPNTGVSYAGVLVFGVAATALVLWRRPGTVDALRSFVRREWRVLAAGEVLFLLVFAGWVVFRAYDPAISGTEKPMDFLFLNASVFAESAPPEDPWLSGFPVAYYYFGYWMFGGLSQLAAVPTFVAFNLSLALVGAMSAGAVFSLVHGLVARDGGTRKAAILCGLAGAGLLLVAANLTGAWEFLANVGVGSDGFYEWLSIDGVEPAGSGGGWRPESHWWWWHASRVINTFGANGQSLDFTIQEFPFFSLMLGDLHPHLMSIPFFLIGIGAAMSLALSAGRTGLTWLRQNPIPAVVLALLLGASGFINAWDLFFLAVLVFGAATIRAYFLESRASARQVRAAGWRARVVGRDLPVVGSSVAGVAAAYRRASSGGSLFAAAFRAALPVAAVTILGVLLFYPFYFGTFDSQVRWPPIGPAAHASRPIHFLTVWGFALLVVTPFLVMAASKALRPQYAWLRREWSGVPHLREGMKPAWSIVIVVALALAVPYFVWAGAHLEVNENARPGDMLGRFAWVLPFMIAAATLLTAALARARRALLDGATFALLAAALAAYLLYGAELLYVHDLFANRMNTVFKLHYQAWIVLAAVGAYGLHYWRSRHVRLRGWAVAASRIAAVAALVLMAGALYYPFAAADSKARSFSSDPTLDGLAFVTSARGAERRAIEWLRDEAQPGERIVEAVGGSYSEFGRVSAATGVPAVLGWPGHEHQWRGETELFEDREGDVERIYKTTDSAEARRLLDKYEVTYLILGVRERREYALAELDRFDELGTRVFEDDNVVIFEVRPDDDD